MHRLILILLSATLVIASCKEDPKKSTAKPKAVVPTKVPTVNEDSLYSFVEQQLEFGYRVPGTKAHKDCKDWIVNQVKGYTSDVTIQDYKVSFLDVKDVDAYNIIASFNPEYKKRIVLAAHWDTRKIAEKDANEENKDKPILGADDGASGVAGLLEIARLLSENEIKLGVDLIFFDAEDQGTQEVKDSYCLGSQYWVKNPHTTGYNPKFGIVLDMIGSKGAQFPKEGFSQRYAKSFQDKIWTLGQAMGYSHLFINQKIGGIQDDHYYMNLARIPTLDIINYDAGSQKFGHYHHTHKDDLDIIDKKTLRGVTQVVMAALYRESDGIL